MEDLDEICIAAWQHWGTIQLKPKTSSEVREILESDFGAIDCAVCPVRDRCECVGLYES